MSLCFVLILWIRRVKKGKLQRQENRFMFSAVRAAYPRRKKKMMRSHLEARDISTSTLQNLKSGKIPGYCVKLEKRVKSGLGTKPVLI